MFACYLKSFEAVTECQTKRARLKKNFLFGHAPHTCLKGKCNYKNEFPPFLQWQFIYSCSQDVASITFFCRTIYFFQKTTKSWTILQHKNKKMYTTNAYNFGQKTWLSLFLILVSNLTLGEDFVSPLRIERERERERDFLQCSTILNYSLCQSMHVSQ